MNDDEVDSNLIDRVCFIDQGSDSVGLINVVNTKANPRIESYKDIIDHLESGGLQILLQDPYFLTNFKSVVCVIGSTDRINKRAVAAKERYSIIEKSLKCNEIDLFIPGARYTLVKSISDQHHVAIPTILKYIRRYYQQGMVWQALFDQYFRSGGAGESKKTYELKRGRPLSSENIPNEGVGININESLRKQLQSGYKKHRITKNKKIMKAYKDTINDCFSILVTEGDVVKKVLPDSGFFPTINQFKYWGEKKYNKRIFAAHQEGQGNYNRNNRPTLGSARDTSGPGSEYQIDATGGLIELVSSRDRSVRIGKAVIYAVQDNYSQLVVGWVVALEHASYYVLSMALEHAFTDKTEYFKRLGIECDSEFLQIRTVCSGLATDGGSELVGYQSDFLAQKGFLNFETLPPGRPDWKPYIERFFGEIKAWLESIPGARRRGPDRGEKDPADYACLTLDDFEKIVVHEIIKFNYGKKVLNHIDEDALLAKGLAPTPINFWKWGVKNRTGAGRSYSEDDIREDLLPRKQVSAGSSGLRLNSLYYSSPSVENKGYFCRNTGSKSPKFILAYDPRDVSLVYLVNPQTNRFIEKCPLTATFAHYKGMSLWEIKRLKDMHADIRATAHKERLELDINVDEMVDELIKDALAKQSSNIKKPKYDEEIRFSEQEEERKSGIKTGTRSISPEPKYDEHYIPSASHSDSWEDDL